MTDTKKRDGSDSLDELVRRDEVNGNGVSVTHFYLDDVEIGHMYSTFHPTIPFEVYPTDKTKRPKRIHTADEAEEWLLEPNVTHEPCEKRL